MTRHLGGLSIDSEARGKGGQGGGTGTGMDRPGGQARINVNQRLALSLTNPVSVGNKSCTEHRRIFLVLPYQSIRLLPVFPFIRCQYLSFWAC